MEDKPKKVIKISNEKAVNLLIDCLHPYDYVIEWRYMNKWCSTCGALWAERDKKWLTSAIAVVAKRNERVP